MSMSIRPDCALPSIACSAAKLCKPLTDTIASTPRLPSRPTDNTTNAAIFLAMVQRNLARVDGAASTATFGSMLAPGEECLDYYALPAAARQSTGSRTLFVSQPITAAALAPQPSIN